jgi:hypothetical protein
VSDFNGATRAGVGDAVRLWAPGPGGRSLRAPFVLRLNQQKESHPHRGWGTRPPAQSWYRGGAVSGVDCRPGCRDMPLYAAIRRSLERNLLIFLGLGFFFEPEGRGFATKLSFVIACA